jgi:ubiquinone/menaquinone biosynthesis C-methylase UbiE
MTEYRDWAEMAGWWDARQGDTGDLWHRALIDPALFRQLGAVDGRCVLDLACGNGYIARRLARLGARVTGVDASGPVIELARARELAEPLGITYHRSDAARLETFDDGTFDLVVSNMALMDMPDAAGALREVGRVLRAGGRLVATLSHPCFDVPQASVWQVERAGYTTTVWRKVGRYREVFEAPVPWRSGEERWQTRAYQRPLSWYVRALRAAGLAIVALAEPAPTAELLANEEQGAWIAEIPLHLVIEALKL